MRNERRLPPSKVTPFPGEEYSLQKATEVVRQNPRSGSFDDDLASFKIVLLMMRSNLPEARAAISAYRTCRREPTKENHEAYGDRFLEFVKVMELDRELLTHEFSRRLLDDLIEWAGGAP